MVMNTDRLITKKLSALVNMQMGPTILQKDLSEDGLPVFSAGNQEHLWGYTNKKVKAFPLGTLVVSARGTIGVPKLPQLDSFTCTQTTIAIQTTEELDVRYLYHFLQSINWDDVVSGVSIPMLTISKLGEVDIILPSIEKQRRIVSALDALVPKVRLIKSRLEKIPSILKIFRQSVLSAACSGVLTKGWRNTSEQDYRRKIVRDLVVSIKYGTSAKCTKEPIGLPILRIPNIQSGYVDSSDLKYAELDESEKSKLQLNEGDLLLVRSNGSVDLVGRTAIVTKEETKYGYAGYLMRLRVDKNKVCPEFLNYCFQSYDMRLQIQLPARSTTGVHNINSTEVKNLELNLPPIDEQREIVRIIDNLFSIADSMETKYQKAMARIDKIEQSILSKTFCSGLTKVCTDIK